MGMDVKRGIASPVMLKDKGFTGRGTGQYIANIAMKVNVKLGGTNCVAHNPIFDQTLVCGAQATQLQTLFTQPVPH